MDGSNQMVAANNAQVRQPSFSPPKQAPQKKNGKCHHYDKTGHWKNECRKWIMEQNVGNKYSVGNGNGSMGGTAIYSAALAIVANTAVAEKLPDKLSMETLWIFGSSSMYCCCRHSRRF